MSGARRPSVQSRRGLDAFAFFVANLQTGFGPFVSVYLTSQKWTQIDIGLVLTLGGIAGLVCQIPGGALVDASRSKRTIASVSLVLIGLSALALATNALFPVILFAWLLHSAASCTLSPSIASISLGLVGHRAIARRLGRNATFASLGSAIAAAAMGGFGYYVSNRSVFIVTAALMVPALFALFRIRPEEIDAQVAKGGTARAEPSSRAGWKSFLTNRALTALAISTMLFFLANAAMLPLVGSVLTLRSKESPALLIAACIIGPQIIVSLCSPWIGARAEIWGRKPLLLVGFAVLPIRGFCLSLVQEPILFVAVQLLDGISAAVLGVLIPLIIADASRKLGRFALAQGIIGTAMGIGGSLSPTFAGYLADTYGSRLAFLGLMGIALVALAVVAIAMPETRPRMPRGVLPEPA